MEQFKVELFEEEYKIPFINYKELRNDECQVLYRKINNIINSRINLTPLKMVCILEEKSKMISNFNANENFNLKECLNFLKIIPNESIYINWYRFDEIDELNFSDFNKFFDDIWFPEVDDINIFDSSLSWILSINHNGVVSIFIVDETYQEEIKIKQ